MPMSSAFQERLAHVLSSLISTVGTPLYVYDERGIRETIRRLKQAFGRFDSTVRNPLGYQNFFAVKALPNREILRLMTAEGFGFDCSSIPELVMAREVGAKPDQIMFTSNNTLPEEFVVAMADGGCILNLDDISLVSKVPEPFPELICFRYNPGAERTGNSIIGNPVEAKYGVASHQIVEAYRLAISRGAKRFGLHTMLCSNERQVSYFVDTVNMLLDLAKKLTAELDIKLEFINIGGGFGIPYKPEDDPLDIDSLGLKIGEIFDTFRKGQGYQPKLFTECGRFVTGPHGALVTRVTNLKKTYKNFAQVDASMSSLMRPGMYWPNGGYHHITVLDHLGQVVERPLDEVNVVGSICENCDQFAHDRFLPQVVEGDILIIHDAGAHGIAMAFQYNGRLRPPEVLLMADGSVKLIRRRETTEDYLRTQDDISGPHILIDGGK